jgi:hypothetical protein
MDPRHAAAFALVACCLMVPPARDGKLLDVPLANWSQFDSFDSAAECRNAGYDWIEKQKKHGDRDKIASAYAFECIASDDPRLKEK